MGLDLKSMDSAHKKQINFVKIFSRLHFFFVDFFEGINFLVIHLNWSRVSIFHNSCFDVGR